jgi:phage FluMu gp28-like protein
LKKINGVPKLGKAKTQTADGKKVQRHGDFAISLFLGHYAMTRDGEAGRCDGYVAIPRRGQVSDGSGGPPGNDDYGGASRRMV